MKILHVIESLDPSFGGLPAVALRLAAAQAALGNDVTVLAYEEPRRHAEIEQSLSAIPHIGQCRLEYMHRQWQERLFGTAARESLRRMVPQFAVAHLHGIWDPLLRIAAGVARAQGVPYVIVPSGMLDPWSLQQKKWKKKLALSLAYRRMLDGALFLHTLNEDEARLISPLELRCPVEIFPNGVFLEEVEPLPPPGSFRNRHRALGNQPFILFLGRLHFKKGLDFLVDAFRIVARSNPHVHLVIAGPDEGAQSAVEHAVATHGLGSRVHLVGALFGREKFEAMVDATCFCLPSRQEGFSLAITEAMACGLPVVISEACHFPEVATVAAGEVVDLNAAAVAAALSRILESPDLQHQMGKAGRDLVRSRYTWPEIARQLLRTYARGGVKEYALELR